MVSNRNPIACSYNGVHLPFLPSYDTTTYPFLYISAYTTAYAFSSAVTVKKSLTTSITPDAPYLKCKLTTPNDYVGKECWSEWEEIAAGTKIYPSTSGWANHDLLKTDGTVFLAKGEDPTPVYLPELLFEGEVTTEDNGYGTYYAEITYPNTFAGGDTIRFTINDTTEEHTVEKPRAEGEFSSGTKYIGNKYLCIDDFADDGGDWCLTGTMRNQSSSDGRYYGDLYTRTVGTYSLKVERIAIEGYEDEPEPDPEPDTTLTARDLYRKINGKPTKLTLYKKLGGKLIPLDEHTKEVKT